MYRTFAIHCKHELWFLRYRYMTKISSDYYVELLEKTLGAWQSGNEGQIVEIRQDLINRLVARCGLSEADVAHLR